MHRSRYPLFCLIILLFASFVFAQPTCGTGYNAEYYCDYHNYDHIFVGRVKSITPATARGRYPFDVTYAVVSVETGLKGAVASEVTLDLRHLQGCAANIAAGTRYIFHAGKKDDEPTVLIPGDWASLENIPADSEEKILSGLRSIIKGGREPSVFGTLKMDDGAPVAGVEIVAKSGDEEFTTRTNRDGAYKFDRLPDGEVTVTPRYPKSLAASDPLYHISKNWRLSGEWPCGRRMDFIASHAGQIVGHIDPNENLSRYPVAYLLAVGPGKLSEESLPPHGEPAGYFSDGDDKMAGFRFGKVAPGRYFIKLIFNQENRELSTYYYPGVRTLEKASVITVAAGQNVDLALNLPDLEEVLIKGYISLPNGAPIRGSIFLIDALDPTVSHSFSAWDRDLNKGYFSFTYYKGRPFHLCAAFDGARWGTQIHLFTFMQNLVANENVRLIATLDRPISNGQHWYDSNGESWYDQCKRLAGAIK
jgi:hypothetical protein